MSNHLRLIRSLIAVFILKQRHKVGHTDCHWTIRLLRVPVALVFCDFDVAVVVVVEVQDLFEDVDQVIQVVD